MRHSAHLSKSSGAAVLMARIVDALGRGIKRADVAAIRYSLLQRCADRPHDVHAVAGYDRILLAVDEVVLNTYQTKSPWNVDLHGYNFRHELQLNLPNSSTNGDTNYELLYELVPKFGDVVALRFPFTSN